MAAKGSIVKAETFKKILEVFPDSFMYNDGKELRINCTEDGVPVQLKLTLTASKEIVEDGEPVSAIKSASVSTSPAVSASQNTPTASVASEVASEPTAEEKERLAKLLASIF